VKPRPGVTVVGFSGPDGSGKSSLLTATAGAADHRGVPVHTTYLYGCVACRNLRLQGPLPRAVWSPGTVALEWPGAPSPAQPSRWHRIHAAIDTAELAVRLQLACHRAGRTARRAHSDVLVLTDRTPLDTLVKHDPPEGGWITQRLHVLGKRYASIALLDAGSDVLSARDGEHAAAGLERTRDNYRRWSGRMTGVRTVSTQAASAEELAREVLDHVLGRGAGSAHLRRVPTGPEADSSS
jgi:energy-coupling factor transporter ATP-binding protein EcfA2